MTVNMQEVISEKINTLSKQIDNLQIDLKNNCEKRQEIGVIRTAYAYKKLADSGIDKEFEKIDENVKSTKKMINLLQAQVNALTEFNSTLVNPESLKAAEKELERIYPMPPSPKSDGLLW